MFKHSAEVALQTGSVDIWYADLATLAIDPVPCYDLLDADERAVVAKLTRPVLRDQYVQSHALVRCVLSCYVNVQPGQIALKRSPQGKPFCLDYPALCFNVSHTASMLVIAVSKSVLMGVDIEIIQPRTQLNGLVARCFAAEEQAYWRGLPEAEKLASFFSFWTRKEAFVKAVGQGITLGLDRCVINPHQPTHFLRVPPQCGAAEDWRIHALDVDPFCRAAVVARLPAFSVAVFPVAVHLGRVCLHSAQ